MVLIWRMIFIIVNCTLLVYLPVLSRTPSPGTDPSRLSCARSRHGTDSLQIFLSSPRSQSDLFSLLDSGGLPATASVGPLRLGVKLLDNFFFPARLLFSDKSHEDFSSFPFTTSLSRVTLLYKNKTSSTLSTTQHRQLYPYKPACS